MKGLYVHIPFCEYICHYCDFVKQVPKNQEMIDTYLIKLREEIYQYRNHFDSIDTIFIGGGTPGMLKPHQLAYLFESLKEIKPSEYSIELNPESYTHEKGLLFKKYHINRVSVGVQTFDNKILKYLNRGHTQDQVFEVIKDLKQLGMDELSIDLIFAIPGQTMDHIQRDLTLAKRLDINHISYYSLILEDKTYFYHQYLRGNFKPMDEDMEAQMYHHIIDDLTRSGFEQYEVSNFARNNAYSKHNTLYWELSEYIGVGLGAHGFIDNERTLNEKAMTKYLDHFRLSSTPQTKAELLQDELIFGLRKTKGVSVAMIKEKYGIDVFLEYPRLKEKMALGLVKHEDGYIALTKEGMMLGNQVFVLFI